MFRLFGLPLSESPPNLEEFLMLVHPDDRHLLKSPLDDMAVGKPGGPPLQN